MAAAELCMLSATNTMSDGEARPRPILDVVACDGADSSPLVLAAHSLQAEVRLTNSPEAWFERATLSSSDPSMPPADLVAFVCNGERMAVQRWASRARTTDGGSRILAVLIEATIQQVMAAVNQGADGLIVLPSPVEVVTANLRELLDSAMQQQPMRREAVRCRHALSTLTTGEQDVLDGMLDGMPNKQIAQRLSIGLRTVELRRSKIMRKMGATNLAQLVKFVCTASRTVC